MSGELSLFAVIVCAAIIGVSDRRLSIVPVRLLGLEISAGCFVIVLVAVELSALSFKGLCWFVQVVHLLSRKFMRFLCPRLVLFH